MTLDRLAALRAAAAVALHPALRRLLLFDANSGYLEHIAEAQAALLEAAVGVPVRRVTLASHHDDDDLWGIGDGLPIAWRRSGLLVSPEDDPSWRLVVIPDLSTLALPSARALVQLLETDLGRLERHGRSKKWLPRLAWLAACPARAIGQVSPHLLDRFPVRLHASWQTGNSRAELRSWLEDTPAAEQQQPDVSATVGLIEAVKNRKVLLPPLTEEGLETVGALLVRWESQGVRRHLGLARLSQALAALDGAEETLRSNVAEAAGIIGISGLREREPQSIPEAPGRPRLNSIEVATISQEEIAHPEIRPAAGGASSPDVQNEAWEPLALPASLSSQEVDIAPFPEDSAAVERFPAALRLPPKAPAGRTYRGGAAVGVVPTADPIELAVIPTLFAAARFQAIRRKNSGTTDSRLLITKADWRARLRTRRPEDLFVLLLDLTAREGCDWPDALIPHVRNAYVRRSAVCIILVGAQGAPHELRAEKILGRSILTPGIVGAFDRKTGMATPLASGLQIALEAIRDAQHRGRNSVVRTTLIVLTDGRGNVPLIASQVGHLSGPVSSEGVDDALEVATRIRTLSRVGSILLDPQPMHCRELVNRLAEALGAQIELVRTRDSSGQEPTQ